jgi:hypothetical protein
MVLLIRYSSLADDSSSSSNSDSIATASKIASKYSGKKLRAIQRVDQKL